MKEIVTNDGKKGGWLKGKPHYDKDGKPLGGIKAVVTDAGGKPVELEGGEVIINKEASAKHWKELSRINQSAGNGVAIGPPSGDYDEDPEEYKEGGKVIEFNANHVPNKWILNYAKNIKEKHPEIWKLGGNIFGNQAFINLKRVSERGYWLDSEKWMYIKWRSYVARHKKDFRIEGVVAMLKWVDKVDKGWAYMKDLIEERIDKIKDKKEGKGWKHKMKNGGGVNDRKGNIKFMEWYVVWYKKISDKINITFSLPHKLSPFKEKNVVILDLFETTDQNIDAKPYLEKIVNKADEYGVTIYLEPMPRYKFSYYQKFGFELTADKNFMKRLPKSNTNEIGSEVMKSGGKTIAQTPAPKKERIYGSKVNKPESAESESKAKSIKLSDTVIESIKNKIKGTGISLATAKAVVRRGMGAYSSSHRPTITGGKPNSRVAWGLARLNAFLYKAEHGKSKSGKYTQDDDLLRESGFRVSKMGNGGKVNGLNIIIKNIGDHSKKYFGVYKKIFDIIEENIAFYNPYGTSYEEIKGNDFYITITPYPEQFIIDKISKLKNVEIVDSFHLGGDMSKHLAPNGKPSNLTHEQWHLVRTPEFKAWFGDWENDPENASKVVDSNGEPLVVYHGTNSEFYYFDKNSESNTYGTSQGFQGFFFTKSKGRSGDYALSKQDLKGGDAIVISAFLSLKNPNIKDAKNQSWVNVYPEQIDNSFDNKNDGVITYNILDGATSYSYWNNNPDDNYIAFEPNQIKLADGTNTTFDGSNRDIRYADGGLIAPNGKQSNLTPEQYKLVRTPEFKAWFGDWENDPANASKVVDDNGEPLVVYHGTKTRDEQGIFNIFKLEKSGKSNKIAKVGFWFTPIKSFAGNFAYNSWWGKDAVFIYNVFLSIKNPKIYITDDTIYGDSYEKLKTDIYAIEGQSQESANFGGKGYALKNEQQTIDNFREKLIQEGFDGILIKNTRYDKKEAGGNNDQYVAFFSNNIKLANGNNTTFDGSNPDIRYEDGGKVDIEEWKTKEPELFKCLLTIRALVEANAVVKDSFIDTHNNIYVIKYEDSNPYFDSIITETCKTLTECEDYLEVDEVEVTDKFVLVPLVKNTNTRYAEGGELAKGIKTEQEHRKTLEKIASGELSVDQAIERTAKDHLKEDPNYYTKLLKMEGKMANGGGVSETSYKLNTPTGEPTKLTYMQQVLVRTQTFKKWFGDWESAAKMFIADNKENFKKHYKGVSKVLDMTTLEPRVVFHGTRSEEEFFMFDVSKEKGIGRPYAYFAHNIEYSRNFTQFSQRGHQRSRGFLYQCFLNIKNPFMAMGQQYEMKNRKAESWKDIITGTIAWDKYGAVTKDPKTENLELAVDAQISLYLNKVAQSYDVPFWNFMARDISSDFKYFLVSYGYDGIFYTEEIATDFDPTNPAQYTKAVTVFNPSDIKLADGRNLNFNPMEADIRMEEGGEVEQTPASATNKKEQLGNLLFGDKYASGGSVDGIDKIITQAPKQELSKERKFVDELIKKMKNGI